MGAAAIYYANRLPEENRRTTVVETVPESQYVSLTPPSVSQKKEVAPVSSQPTPAAAGGEKAKIKVEVSPTTVALEVVLQHAEVYIQRQPWKAIEKKYAPNGLVVSIADYQGNDKGAACNLALVRFFEATIGLVVSLPPFPPLSYIKLQDEFIEKGMRPCSETIDLKKPHVLFGSDKLFKEPYRRK